MNLLVYFMPLPGKKPILILLFMVHIHAIVVACTKFSINPVTESILAIQAIKPSIITFPPLTFPFKGLNVSPGATSTNNETPITYTSSNPAVATITIDGLLHIIGAGVSIITATQSGNNNYSQATPVTSTLTVTEEQFIKFPAISDKFICDTDFVVGAISYNPILPPSSIPINYTSSDPSVAAVSAQGVIHILSAGTTIITAYQNGDNIYIAAPPMSQTLKVTLPTNPVVNITADRTSVCAGSLVTFTAKANNVRVTDNLFYQWQVNGTIVNAGSNFNVFVTAIKVQTDVVKCTVINKSACQTTGENSHTGFTITPNLTPSVTITSSAISPTCIGSAITFTATTTNAGINPTYQWQVNGKNYGINSSQFISSTLANNDKVTCTVTNNNDPCLVFKTALSNTLQANIITPLNTSVSISASANHVRFGTPVTFIAKAVNAGTGLNYQWQVNGANAGNNNSIFTVNNLNYGDKINCVLYMSGCVPSVTSNTILMDIIETPTIKVNNAFTPNEDGINDTWVIQNLNQYHNCTVKVFNRYGQLVFSSTGYGIAWDGKYNNKPLPMGTYYYVIDLKYNAEIISGAVTIIR